MATGRVWGRFFYTRTRPVGPSRDSSPHAQPSLKSETQISIYDFSSQNHKHKHESKHNHKHKYRNHKHKFQIYDFPFQNHKPNTNFRFMIFPFKITNTNTEIINTNTNSHDWDKLNPEKKNGEWGGVRLWDHGRGRWEAQRVVRWCEIGDGKDEMELRE